MRLLAGCVLLAMAGMWVYNNDIVSSDTIQNFKATATSGDVKGMGETLQQGVASAAQNTDVRTLLGTSGWAVAIAGLLIAASSFVSGWRMSLFAIPAVLVAIFGPALGIPAIGPLSAWMIACAGAFVIMIPGALTGE